MKDKKPKYQLVLDVAMILVAIFMTIDYSLLIYSGDDLLRRKIVLAIWFLAIFGWSIKFIYDVKQSRLKKLNSK